MGEMRQDPVGGDWVIFAPEREKRPAPGRGREDCPFCPGHESQTPPALYRYPEDDQNWLIRVVPNRYPALSFQTESSFFESPLYRWGKAGGRHEVIIEHCQHYLHDYDYPREHIERLLQIYQLRMRLLQKEEEIQYVVLFKNSGPSAGATISHPHSQVLSLPFIPEPIMKELDHFKVCGERMRVCLLCHLLEEERKTKERIIDENQHFITMVPFASPSPYLIWIVPREHSSSFLLQTPEELESLSWSLTRVLAGMKTILKRPSFNLTFHVSPGLAYLYHWYLVLTPRITIQGGFEMATGVMINPTSPEEAAQRLKQGLKNSATHQQEGE